MNSEDLLITPYISKAHLFKRLDKNREEAQAQAIANYAKVLSDLLGDEGKSEIISEDHIQTLDEDVDRNMYTMSIIDKQHVCY